MSIQAGMLPLSLSPLLVAMGSAAVLFGLGASTLALVGLRASRRGQPGPALAGVFPVVYALGIAAVGVVPLALVLFAVTRAMNR